MEYILNVDNFEKEVLESNIPVLIDFYADWCGPCKMMMPVINKIAEKYDGKIKVGKVNSDENGELAEKYKVMSIPNFILFKDGKIVANATGVVSINFIEQMIDKNL